MSTRIRLKKLSNSLVNMVTGVLGTDKTINFCDSYFSLLVTADHNSREIAGLLRFADVFGLVSDAMHECVLK